MEWRVTKVFHIKNDLSENTPEKVFSVDHELEKLKVNLKGECRVSGLVGPINSIIDHLTKHSGGCDGRVMGSLEAEKTSLKKKMELNNDEIASLLVIQTPQAIQQKEHKEDYSEIHLVFVVRDQVFYIKPYNKKSISYMLIRYIGDLCDDITVLYDHEIEKEFSPNNCPYNVTNNDFGDIKMYEKKVEDVKLGEVQVKCDMSKFYEFDPAYFKNTKFDNPMPIQSLIHKRKLSRTQLKQKTLTELHEIQQLIWQMVFQNQVREPSRVLHEIGREEDESNREIIGRIVAVYDSFKQSIIEFATKCLFRCARRIISPSNRFKQNSYFYCVKEHISFLPTGQTIQLIGRSQFFKNMGIEILYECDGSTKKLQDCHGMYCLAIQDQWNATKEFLCRIVGEFCQISSQFLNRMENEQMIQFNRFDLKGVYDREDVIQQISLQKHHPITLNSSVLKTKFELPSFQHLIDFNIWELNKQFQLLWFSFKVTAANPYSGSLLTMRAKQLRLVSKYKWPHIKFEFNCRTERGYLLNLDNCSLNHFQINSVSKIFNEQTACYAKNWKIEQRGEQRIIKDTNQIISFGLTVNPHEKLFFLTEARNVLYSFNIAIKDENEKYKEFYQEYDGQKVLSSSRQKYNYLKLFNEDIFVALGTDEFIDIAQLTACGTIEIQKRIELNRRLFIGTSIYADNRNQYLIIHQIHSTKAYVFYNMNMDHILKMEEENHIVLGNPIIDIFYEAYEKFGAYRTYSVGQESQEFKQLTLHHVSTIRQSIKQYMELLNLERHVHHYYTPDNYWSLYTRRKAETISSQSLLIELQTRIPIQLCTLQANNIVSMIRGKRSHQNPSETMSIVQKCRILDFGIIQRLLLEEKGKGIYVVSVMGAQSSGKSYLMNRTFGTRFAVASSRTTVGIWASLVKVRTFNFLILDCQGLFAPDRSPQEEEKLIKILASLSDLTILNQNMGINSRSIVDLLERISQSAGKAIRSSREENQTSLYQGSLLTIVRDTKREKAKELTSQFYRNFEANERKQANGYLMRLFGGKITIYCIANYETRHFNEDIKGLWNQILNKATEKKLKHRIRKCEEVLDTLKMVLAKLSYDDSNEFTEDLKELRVERQKEEVIAVWLKSTDSSRITKKITSKSFEFINSNVNMESLQDTSPISFFKQQLFQRLGDKRNISTIEFNIIYTEFNEYLIRFFEIRQKAVEQKLTQVLKKIPEERQVEFETEIRNCVTESRNNLRLCLSKCYDKQCNLLCIKEFKHQAEVKKQKEAKRNKIKELRNQEELNKLTQQQQQWKEQGIEIVKNKLEIQIQALNQQKNSILELIDRKQKVQHFQARVESLKIEIRGLEKSAENKAMTVFISTLQSVHSSVQNIKHPFPEISYLMPQQIKKLLTQNHGKKYQKIKEIPEQISKYQTVIGQLQKVRRGFEEMIKSLKQQSNSLKQQLNSKQQKCTEISMTIQTLTTSIGMKKQYVDQLQLQLNCLAGQILKCQNELHHFLPTIQSIPKQKLKIQALINQVEAEIQQQEEQLALISSKYKLKVSELEHQRQKITSFDELVNKIQSYRKAVREIKAMDEDFQFPSSEFIRDSTKVLQPQSLENVIEVLGTQIRFKQGKIDKIKNPKLMQDLIYSLKVQNQYKVQCEIGIFLSENEIKVIFYDTKFCFVPQTAVQQPLKLNFQLQIKYFLKEKQYQSPEMSQLLESSKDAKFDQLINTIEKSLNQKEQQLVDAEDQESVERILAEQKVLEKKNHELQLAKQFWQSRELLRSDQIINQQSAKRGAPQQPLVTSNHGQVEDKQLDFRLIYKQEIRNELSEAGFIAGDIEEYIELDQNHITQKKQKINQQLRSLAEQSKEIEDESAAQQRTQAEKQQVKLQILEKAIPKARRYVQSHIKLALGEKANHNVGVHGVSFQIEAVQQSIGKTYRLNQLSNQQLYSSLRKWNATIGSFYINLFKNISESNHSENVHEKLSTIVTNISLLKPQDLSEQQMIRIIYRPLLNLKQTHLKRTENQLEEQLLLISREKAQLESQLSQRNKDKQRLLLEQQIIIQSIESRVNQYNKARAVISEKKTQLKEIQDRKQEATDLINRMQQSLKSLKDEKESTTQQSTQLNQILSSTLAKIKVKMQDQQGIVVQPIEEFEAQLHKLRKEMDANSLLQQKKWLKNYEIQKCNTKITKLRSQVQEMERIVDESTLNEIEHSLQNHNHQAEQVGRLVEKLRKIGQITKEIGQISRQIQQIDESPEDKCSCQTNHMCDQLCQVGCKQRVCSRKAGHQGTHICDDNNHFCGRKCEFLDCTGFCEEKYGHYEQVPHRCSQSHNCKETCRYCEKNCVLSRYEAHEIHVCDETRCTKTCIYCHEPCNSPDHTHDDKAQLIQICIWNQIQGVKKYRRVKKTLHMCSNEHSCRNACQHPGVCKYSYQEEQKVWEKDGKETEYTYFRQNEQKSICSRRINAGEYTHEGECFCTENHHHCRVRCPDCLGLCQEAYGHLGKHRTEHRNQQSLKYVVPEEIDKQLDIKSGYALKAGDISLPFRCNEACASKGRAHVHLIKCPGGLECLEIQLEEGARHSKKKFYPFYNEQYDEVLCTFYWQYHNFEAPVYKEQFAYCNFACAFPHPELKEEVYCPNAAWHEGNHQFSCTGTHKTPYFQEMQICFLIDATFSMDKHIKACKEVIKKIIEAAYSENKKQNRKQVKVQFAIVAYRDHPMSQSPINIQLKDLCDRKTEQLLSMHNAIADSLIEKKSLTLLDINKQYKKFTRLCKEKNREEVSKQFDERQNFIFKYSFPFVMDLVSEEPFMTFEQQCITNLQGLGESLKSFVLVQCPLKEFLIERNSKCKNTLLESEKKQEKNSYFQRLTEVQEFADEVETLRFLSQLEACGGGDPPEAVLDGMYRVAELGWTPGLKTRRYVFHLMDAPPHGRQYSTGHSDKFPDGCPCQKTHEQAIRRLLKLQLDYRFYKFNNSVNETLELFRLQGLDFQIEQIEKEIPELFVVKVTEFIAKEMGQNNFFVNFNWGIDE